MFLSSLSIFENRFLLSQNILESKSVAVPPIYIRIMSLVDGVLLGANEIFVV